MYSILLDKTFILFSKHVCVLHFFMHIFNNFKFKNELDKKSKRISHLDSLVMDKENQIQSLHTKLADATKKIA